MSGLCGADKVIIGDLKLLPHAFEGSNYPVYILLGCLTLGLGEACDLLSMFIGAC